MSSQNGDTVVFKCFHSMEIEVKVEGMEEIKYCYNHVSKSCDISYVFEDSVNNKVFCEYHNELHRFRLYDMGEVNNIHKITPKYSISRGHTAIFYNYGKSHRIRLYFHTT